MSQPIEFYAILAILNLFFLAPALLFAAFGSKGVTVWFVIISGLVGLGCAWLSLTALVISRL